MIGVAELQQLKHCEEIVLIPACALRFRGSVLCLHALANSEQMYVKGKMHTQSGAPALFIKLVNDVKPVTTIEQNGDEFSISVKTALKSTRNSFIIGQESEFHTPDGGRIKATARLLGGKIVIEAEKFTHVRELLDGQMIETISAGDETLIRRSRRL
ncbi:hypothetical protein DNTS_008419 [Danionella cerebrum]|uniref:Lipocalin/cytosolic fatty-acid binding domain-containing protein n=1 Tax=Danionella cerebrum TaxID=2873325 RepID=A0A553MTU4_9TELE|nr:hypothetical protein DNTS_008419 [Danionella translucida]